MSHQLFLTDLGKQKLAQLATTGQGNPLTITEFVVGSGRDVDFSTRLDRQSLVSKKYQAQVQDIVQISPSQYEISCVIPANIGGFSIREVGLLAGDILMWVGSLPEVQKPTLESLSAVDYRIKCIISLDNHPNIELSVDGNVITATRTWVEEKLTQLLVEKMTAMQAELEALKARPIIPVGGLFITTKHYKNGEAVTADLGYGKWMRALIGRTGVGFDPNASDWTGTMGQKYGSNEHQLTIEEIPSHKHSHGEVFTMFGAKAGDSNHITTITSHDRNATGAEYGVGNMSNTDWNNAKERTIGGNRPHNNVQKSEVIAYWQRMPDNYVRLEPIIDVYFTSDKQGKRKITEINEGQNAYLWVEAQNLLSEIEIGAKIDTQNKNINIHKANLAFPNTIDNGKIRIGDIGKITVAEDVTLKMGINYLHDTSKEFLADLLVKDITKRITLKLGLIKQTYHNTEVVMISTHTIASNSDDSDYLPQFVEFDADGNRSLGADIAKKTEVYQLNFSTGDYKAFRNPRLYDIWFYLPTTLPIEQINISSSEELFGYRLERYTGVYNGFYPDNLPPALRTQSRDWIILRADDRLEVPVYTSLHRIPVYINIDF